MEITLINTNLVFGNASTEDVTLTVVKKAGTLNNSGSVRESDANDYGEVDISQFNTLSYSLFLALFSIFEY